MASFTAGDSIDWLWGGLKPWQILHSTLAERERCGNVQDVWELVNQTLSTTSKSWNSHGEEADRGKSREIQFLGDLMDVDFWRHGGVIELRVKECLNSLLVSQNDEAEEDDHQTPSAAADHHHHYAGLYKCTASTEVAIASCTTHELPYIAWRSVADANHNRHINCPIREEEASGRAGITLEDDASGAADDLMEERAGNQGSDGYTSDEEEEDEEEEEDGDDQEEDDSGNRRNSTQRIREASNGVISRSHLAGPSYRSESVKDGTSILVLNPCCSTALDDHRAGAAINVWGDQSSESAELERTAAGVSELENVEVCAVCLEKLTHYHEEGVQALECRHAFHRVCIEPWLEREPQACCPCCRAPILAEALAPPLHFWADHHLLQDGRYAGGGGGGGGQPEAAQSAAGMGIMGVLADVEAALERLGFRS